MKTKSSKTKGTIDDIFGSLSKTRRNNKSYSNISKKSRIEKNFNNSTTHSSSLKSVTDRSKSELSAKESLSERQDANTIVIQKNLSRRLFNDLRGTSMSK